MRYTKKYYNLDSLLFYIIIIKKELAFCHFDNNNFIGHLLIEAFDIYEKIKDSLNNNTYIGILNIFYGTIYR